MVAIVAIGSLHLLLQKTKIGKGMRAVADNIDLARVSGIDVEQIVLFTWVITGILTALAGVIRVDDSGTSQHGMVFVIAHFCVCDYGWYWQSLWGDCWGFDYWHCAGDECIFGGA